MSLFKEFVFSITPIFGFGTTDVNWNISGDYNESLGPNVLSELEYNDINHLTHGFSAEAIQYFENKNIEVYGLYSRSFSSSRGGEGIDSDYADNGREGAFSISTSDLSNSKLDDWNIEVGIRKLTNSFIYSVNIGKNHLDQNIIATNGSQTLADPEFFEEDITTINQSLKSLNSSYNTDWDSYYVGFGIEKLFSRSSIFFGVKYLDSNFDASANWNLREDLDHPVSFIHSGDGDGHSLQFSHTFDLTRQSRIITEYQRSKIKASGNDITFLSDDISQLIGFSTFSTKLNKVDSKNQSLSISWQVDF